MKRLQGWWICAKTLLGKKLIFCAALSEVRSTKGNLHHAVSTASLGKVIRTSNRYVQKKA